MKKKIEAALDKFYVRFKLIIKSRNIIYIHILQI
jgi:hypothetical protein